MELVPFEDGAVLRQLRGSAQLAHLSPTALQRWIREELGVQVDEVVATTFVAEQVMDLERGMASHLNHLFRQALETIGAEVDDVRSHRGTDPATAPGVSESFSGRADVPPLLSAFATEALKNLGSSLLATQQLASRNMAEVVNRGMSPPADMRHPTPPKRGWRGWSRG